MKKSLKVIGIATIVTGILIYPAFKLFQYLTKEKEDKDAGEGDHHIVKSFIPAYRGKHKTPHHRP